VHVRPSKERREFVLDPGGSGGRFPQSAAVRGDKVEAFNCSGGTPRWPGVTYVLGNPMEEGAQLLCSQYIGAGLVGFVKMIKACPFKPSILHNASSTELVPAISQATLFTNGNFSDSDNGWWSTPFGWEGYTTNVELGGEPPPSWEWRIQLVQGRLETIRNSANVPPFSFFDPNSWLLAPNVPVPASTYQSGFPGNPPDNWRPQRMQWYGWESGEVHIVVPEDTTVCLFARWSQLPHNVTYQSTTGAGTVDLEREVFILGPSFGQLVGYTQPRLRKAAGVNAVHGWAS